MSLIPRIKLFKQNIAVIMIMALMPYVASCAQVDVPGARNLRIPSPTMADARPDAVNDKPDSVIYLPLGSDVLVPEAFENSPLPSEIVGPFELRSETLAGALQLILADYDIPMAFESDEGLTRTITVANLRGPLNRVVEKVCSLADLYCAFEDGLLVIKDTQTFTVSVPPIGGDTDVIAALASGLQAITGQSPITDEATRTIVYQATNRTSKLAERYFQRIRSNTALIVFEVYIWEVVLDSGNSTGIDWDSIETFGKFSAGINFPGSATSIEGATPVSIGLPTVGNVAFDGNDVFEFISAFGAVKTISQPQITTLSGSEATLRVADTENYVSSLSRSVDNGEVTVSTETDSVDTGFTLTINSAWDRATVYGTIQIDLQENLGIETFPVDNNGSQIGLPQTTERELNTQIRIRPGDSLLIAGLVRESDQFNKSGPGFNQPIIPLSRRAEVETRELVFLLKPRVIVYTAEDVNKIKRDKKSGMLPVGAPQKQAVEEFPETTVTVDMLNPAN